jgi:hypothetical protein
VYVYLRTTPELAKQRIEQRGRPEEQALSMWYCPNILHQKVLDHRKLLSRFPRKNIVCKGFYVKQLADDVHLRGYLYKNLTDTLIKREIMKIC